MPDERSLIEFKSPQPLSVCYPDLTESYCSVCGKDKLYPASELMIIKYQTSSHPEGHLMTYCPKHFAQAKAEWEGTGGAVNTGPVCPVCFIEVPLTRVCDEHGPIDK
jgi:hypothetical protein